MATRSSTVFPSVPTRSMQSTVATPKDGKHRSKTFSKSIPERNASEDAKQPLNSPDTFIYSHESVFEQLKTAVYELGYFRLLFYTQDGLLAKSSTDTISEFFLYPSGGTLRDAQMNIVLYDSKYDFYRGFQLPSGKA